MKPEFTVAEQNFHRGDRVWVKKPKDHGRQHFQGDRCALIDGSYADLCRSGRPDTTQYAVIFMDGDQCDFASAWYGEENLQLLNRRTLKSIEKVEEYHRREYTDD